MKKFFIAVLIILSVATSVRAGGQIRTTPQPIILTNPTTSTIELLSIQFNYSGEGNHYAIIRYNIIDSNNDVRSEEAVHIRNTPDNALTDPTECTDVGVPNGCCTGAYPGDPNEDCDETDLQFNAFTSGFLNTLSSRSDQAVWMDIQSKFPIQ